MFASVCRGFLFPGALKGTRRCLCASAASKSESNPATPGDGSANTVDKSAPEASSDIQPELEALKEKLAKESEKVAAITDKYRRALAENENQRIRLNKKIEEAKVFGIQKFSKDLLDISDTLSKALESVSEQELNENEALRNLFNGLKLTETQLIKVFSKHSLCKIDPIGEPFNPHEHEAVFYQPMEGKSTGTVINVQKVGFKLDDRVIRPAIVGVAK